MKRKSNLCSFLLAAGSSLLAISSAHAAYGIFSNRCENMDKLGLVAHEEKICHAGMAW